MLSVCAVLVFVFKASNFFILWYIIIMGCFSFFLLHRSILNWMDRRMLSALFNVSSFVKILWTRGCLKPIDRKWRRAHHVLRVVRGKYLSKTLALYKKMSKIRNAFKFQLFSDLVCVSFVS